MRTPIAAVLALAALAAAAAGQQNFPPPAAPAQNQFTQPKALLGMALFWEEQMSFNDTVACGTCHSFGTAGTDARDGGVNPGRDGQFGTADDVHGSRGVSSRNADLTHRPSAYQGDPTQVTPRKAPSMINAAYSSQLFYDGRVSATGFLGSSFLDPVTGQVAATGPVALEMLVLQPPLNPVEMGYPGRTWTDVANKIASSRPLALANEIPPRLGAFLANRSYPQLFAAAFGTPDVTPVRIAFAIATYLRTLVSDQSRFDQMLAGNYAMNTVERRGRDLFMGSATNNPVTIAPAGQVAACAQCHSDITARSHVSGPSISVTYYGPALQNFHNIGLRPIEEDAGATGGRFKVPGLRNVSLHGSLGHNGRIPSVAAMIDFYDRGGDYHVQQAAGILPRQLTAADKDALLAFLDMLTDPRVASGQEPFDSPLLGSQTGSLPRVIGVGTAGTLGRVPRMLADDVLTPGSPRVTIGLANSSPDRFAVLLWDLGAFEPGIVAFGPAIYCAMIQPTIVAIGMTQTELDGSGKLTATLAVPNNGQLRGMEVFTQWLLFDQGGINGLAASPGVSMTVR